MKYIKVKQAAERWGLSERRVRALCEQGKIDGVLRDGRSYLIPTSALKPADSRRLKGKSIPEELFFLYNRVDSYKEELKKRGPLPEELHVWMEKDFIADFTCASNGLDGNTMNLAETAAVLGGQVVAGRSIKEHLEVVAGRQAFGYAWKAALSGPFPTERGIKNIHSALMLHDPENRGVYRRTRIDLEFTEYQPPAPYLIADQMEQLIAQTRDSHLHPIETAARFHLSFEAIHPFGEGNGRTGRLILNIMLVRSGYLPVSIQPADKKRYFSCFNEFENTGDCRPMVEFLCRLIEVQYSKCLRLL